MAADRILFDPCYHPNKHLFNPLPKVISYKHIINTNIISSVTVWCGDRDDTHAVTSNCAAHAA